MSTHAKVSISDQVAEILFFEENERKPCTIDWDVLDELEKIFDEIEKSEVRVVLVKSAHFLQAPRALLTFRSHQRFFPIHLKHPSQSYTVFSRFPQRKEFLLPDH